MIKVLEAPLAKDLQPLSVYWWKNNIPHRVSEVAGKQVIFVENNDNLLFIQQSYADFCNGNLNISISQNKVVKPILTIDWLQLYPVTLALALLSIAGFLLVQFKLDYIVDLLVIQGIDNTNLVDAIGFPERISTNEYLAHGQYWRLITPIFLHFGWLHIVFNTLWLWELGRRIEVQGGSIHLLCIVIFVGISSNLYQAESTPLATFGGMSGVIYGLLGYCAAFNWVSPKKSLELPIGIYVLMLVSLAVGYSGLFDFLARMANTAHLSGLVLGVLAGFSSALVARLFPDNG